MSCSSRGPSSVNRPPDWPWARASNVSTAYPFGARSVSATPFQEMFPSSVEFRVWPSPWKIITAGQPAGGAGVVGSKNVAAIGTPSLIVIVTSVFVNPPAGAGLDHASAAARPQIKRRIGRRTTGGKGIRTAALLQSPGWIHGPSACSTPGWGG